MSKQANRFLAEFLANKEEGVEWDRVVEEIRHACGVQENTAEQYIRRSENAVIEESLQRGKIAIAPEQAGETVVHEDDALIEKEVGDPTGRYFGNLQILEDVGHPEVPREHEDGYYRRRMGDENTNLSRKTDVDVVTSSMADADFSTLLIGKHGVGKDKLILHICANANRPVIRLVANDDPDFIDLLIGTYSPSGDGGFEHRKGLLSVAIENGYTMVIDEFNTLSGKVQTMLNKILEDSDSNKLVIPETNQVIEPHDQFRFVATQNPNDIGYGGREDLDQATGSRFIPIKLPPLSETGERKVVAKQTEWSKDSTELDKLLGENGGVISGIRTLHEMGKLSMWISTRDVIQIGRMANRMGDVKAATELVLLGRVSKENEETIRSNINDKHW